MPDFVGWRTAKYTGVNFTGNWNTEELSEEGYLCDPTKAAKETGKKLCARAGRRSQVC
jgi:creatinine amidohydrolase/Fe(II)-dependent formamide hydrolase-like protein